MGTPLRNKTIAILATDGFEQVELTEPKRAVEQAGATTRILSIKDGQIQGMHHDKKGDTFAVDAQVADASIDDYDALLLPAAWPTRMRCAWTRLRWISSATSPTAASRSASSATAPGSWSRPTWSAAAR